MADVSCRRCGEGFWVTGPAEWTTCPECPDDVASTSPAEHDDGRAVIVLVLGLWIVAIAVLIHIARWLGIAS